MISDILKCDKVEDTKSVVNNRMSSSMDSNLLDSYINNSNGLSYIPLQNRYLWPHSLDTNLGKGKRTLILKFSKY